MEDTNEVKVPTEDELKKKKDEKIKKALLAEMPQLNYEGVPERVREQIQAYVEDGTLPNEYLQAIISDSLSGVFRFCSTVDEIRDAYTTSGWITNSCPGAMYGSHEKMTRWNLNKGLTGLVLQANVLKAESQKNGATK